MTKLTISIQRRTGPEIILCAGAENALLGTSPPNIVATETIKRSLSIEAVVEEVVVATEVGVGIKDAGSGHTPATTLLAKKDVGDVIKSIEDTLPPLQGQEVGTIVKSIAEEDAILPVHRTLVILLEAGEEGIKPTTPTFPN